MYQKINDIYQPDTDYIVVDTLTYSRRICIQISTADLSGDSGGSDVFLNPAEAKQLRRALKIAIEEIK